VPAPEPPPVPLPPPLTPAPPPQPYAQPYAPPEPYDYGPPGGYTEPGYGAGYPPPPPQRPLEPPPKPCCLWSLRYDPFDLIHGQVTLEGEIALGDLPLSIELVPSWIFDNFSDAVDEQGFDIAARFGWYVQGDALRGFFLKAHAEFQWFEATLFRGDLDGEQYFGKPGAMCNTDSATGTCTLDVNSFLLGLMIGNSSVFGDDGGFALTGGLGVGVAIAQELSLEVQPCSDEDVAAGNAHCSAADNGPVDRLVYFEGAGLGRGGRVNIIGSLSLGVTF
jgi:hypothetical protein